MGHIETHLLLESSAAVLKEKLLFSDNQKSPMRRLAASDLINLPRYTTGAVLNQMLNEFAQQGFIEVYEFRNHNRMKKYITFNPVLEVDEDFEAKKAYFRTLRLTPEQYNASLE